MVFIKSTEKGGTFIWENAKRTYGEVNKFNTSVITIQVIIKLLYFPRLRIAFLKRLDLNPLVSSRIYKHLECIKKKISTENVISYNRRTRITIHISIEWRAIINCSLKGSGDEIEKWLMSLVKRSRQCWQPATTWRSDSGPRQKEQSGLCDDPHRKRFLRVARELFM